MTKSDPLWFVLDELAEDFPEDITEDEGMIPPHMVESCLPQVVTA